jgi:hypothetical protein
VLVTDCSICYSGGGGAIHRLSFTPHTSFPVLTAAATAVKTTAAVILVGAYHDMCYGTGYVAFRYRVGLRDRWDDLPVVPVWSSLHFHFYFVVIMSYHAMTLTLTLTHNVQQLRSVAPLALI